MAPEVKDRSGVYYDGCPGGEKEHPAEVASFRLGWEQDPTPEEKEQGCPMEWERNREESREDRRGAGG